MGGAEKNELKNSGSFKILKTSPTFDKIENIDRIQDEQNIGSIDGEIEGKKYYDHYYIGLPLSLRSPNSSFSDSPNIFALQNCPKSTPKVQSAKRASLKPPVFFDYKDASLEKVKKSK